MYKVDIDRNSIKMRCSNTDLYIYLRKISKKNITALVIDPFYMKFFSVLNNISQFRDNFLE